MPQLPDGHHRCIRRQPGLARAYLPLSIEAELLLVRLLMLSIIFEANANMSLEKGMALSQNCGPTRGI